MPPVASTSAQSHRRRRHKRRRSTTSASTSQFRHKASLALLGLLLLALVGSLGVIGYTASQGEPAPAATLDEPQSPAFTVSSTTPADTTPAAAGTPTK